MKVSILCFIVVFVCSCKPKLLDLPPIPVYERLEEYSHSSNRSFGSDLISGVIKYPDKKIVTSAAIKLVVNDSVCVNSYSNYDGLFSVLYDKEMINSKSHFVVLFKGYSEKKVLFSNFQKDSVITLDTIGHIVTEKEYLYFYEGIRSCTR